MNIKKLIKRAILAVLWVLVLPLGASAWVCLRLFGSSQVFTCWAQMLSLLPGLPGSYIRACFYHQTLAEGHLDTEYCFGAIITKPEARIGHGVIISKYASIGLADIGDGTGIGGYVSVVSGARLHNVTDISRPIFDGLDKLTRVVIGHETFIGEHSVIMADVGHHTVIGAGSVVVKPIADGIVAIGNLARVIKVRISPDKAASSDI